VQIGSKKYKQLQNLNANKKDLAGFLAKPFVYVRSLSPYD